MGSCGAAGGARTDASPRREVARRLPTAVKAIESSASAAPAGLGEQGRRRKRPGLLRAELKSATSWATAQVRSLGSVRAPGPRPYGAGGRGGPRGRSAYTPVPWPPVDSHQTRTCSSLGDPRVGGHPTGACWAASLTTARLVTVPPSVARLRARPAGWTSGRLPALHSRHAADAARPVPIPPPGDPLRPPVSAKASDQTLESAAGVDRESCVASPTRTTSTWPALACSRSSASGWLPAIVASSRMTTESGASRNCSSSSGTRVAQDRADRNAGRGPNARARACECEKIDSVVGSSDVRTLTASMARSPVATEVGPQRGSLLLDRRSPFRSPRPRTRFEGDQGLVAGRILPMAHMQRPAGLPNPIRCAGQRNSHRVIRMNP